MDNLILHTCCAPDLTYSYEYFSKTYNVFALFVNDNMDTFDEFQKRYEEVLKVAKHYGFECKNLEYENEIFLKNVVGLEDEPEMGKRCEVCHLLNFRKTANFCKENGFKIFSTTLTISPHKNVDLINSIGERVAKEFGLEFVKENLKKNDGFLKSVKISKELNLYRQNYCGCIFSRGKSGQGYKV
ncbi:MAG: epoxyqueuosine reductase QueH [candidate division WOR-3 bacterium]